MQLFSVFKRQFVKNVMILVKGSAFSQIILYLTIPILTRLFSEELFGVYMLFSSTIILLKPIASLQFELAILLPKRDKDAANFVVFTAIVLVLITTILFLILSIFKSSILIFFNIESLSEFIFLIPLSVLLYGLITILDYWSNRKNEFKNIYFGVITKSATMSVSQVSIGLSSLNCLGLIPGMIIGQFLQFLVLLKKTINGLIAQKKHINFKRMFFLAKKYKDIPTFNSLLNFTNTLSNELPILLISKYFGLASAGVYGLAVKVGKAPVGIIQQSISQVFYNKASKTYNLKGDLSIVVKKTYTNLLGIAFAIFIPIFIVSFYLDFIFGEGWTKVGLYVRILIPWLFIMFLSSPLTSLIVILNRQKTILVYDILLLIFRFLAFFVGFKFYNDIIIALLLFSAVGVVFNIFILIYFLKISKSTAIVYK